jgi:hypothetical protein
MLKEWTECMYCDAHNMVLICIKYGRRNAVLGNVYGMSECASYGGEHMMLQYVYSTREDTWYGRIYVVWEKVFGI